MRKQKINPPVKTVILVIIIFIALFLIPGYLAMKLKGLDYFKIKDIIINKPEGTFDFSYLSGRSIFNIDLNKESRYISEQYPVYKNIRLFRLLPNRLFISFTDRNPVAYVKLYRYFCVDSDRVFFDIPQGRQASDLPVIIGLERKIQGPRPGRQYNSEELIAALSIIKESESNNLSKKYKIERVDVSSLSGISCFISRLDYSHGKAPAGFKAVVEVKFAADDIGDKARVLAGLFANINDDISNIKYIDLRFKEPVVKFNEGKS